MRDQITGNPCDGDHPFPAPPASAWADSMEFGALQRQPTTNMFAMQDVDTTPTWRAMGAWIWQADCAQGHLGEIAESTILTTHLLAPAMLSRKSAGRIESLAFGQVGGNDAIAALLDGGLGPAHEQVKRLHVGLRQELVGECMALVLNGYTNLQLDLEASYIC